MIGLLISLFVGGVAGAIAAKIMNKKSGFFGNILLGIVGGFVGNLVLGLIGFSANGSIAGFVTSILGACIFIWLGRKLFK